MPAGKVNRFLPDPFINFTSVRHGKNDLAMEILRDIGG